MNRILNRLAKIRTDDKPKKMQAHDSFVYNIADKRKFFVTFYLDPMDQVGSVFVKLEDEDENVIDAIEIFIPQDPSEHLSVNHDKAIVFSGSKEEKQLKKENDEIRKKNGLDPL